MGEKETAMRVSHLAQMDRSALMARVLVQEAQIDAGRAREAALVAEREGWRTVGVALLEYFGARDTLDALRDGDGPVGPFLDAAKRCDTTRQALRAAFEAQREAIGTARLTALAATAPDAGVGGV